MRIRPARRPWLAALALPFLLGLPGPAAAQDEKTTLIPSNPGTLAIPPSCNRTVHAKVAAIDQVWFWNRLGAVQPQGMMYALEGHLVPISGTTLSPGNVRLRPDMRPRPIVLRMNVGDCLEITFRNLLSPTRRDDDQSNTRWASIHAVGLQLRNAITEDGSYVGANANSQVDVGQTIVYTYYAEREGQHVIYSKGAVAGGEGDGGHVNSGLFGAIVVEPSGSTWYRSQVTQKEFGYATSGTTANGFPIINYGALYPPSHPWLGFPVLEMLSSNNEILRTDLTAIIVGSNPQGGAGAGAFPSGTFPANATLPQRDQPFREFVIIYHDEIGAVQAFPQFEDPVLAHTLHSGRDAFAINYGTGGIGAEILANRFKVGPMHGCTECKYEEFFLTSWAVGDPAMVVDVPANAPCMVNTTSPNTVGQDPALGTKVSGLRNPPSTPCAPTQGAKATKAFFPEDPSNVYHGYLNDHTRFRVLHAGSKEHHVHHLHAHQWLYSADSDKSSYLDSQAIGPGASFTAEIAYNGGGNLNRTVGDSIFHCHFYPHFAQGMWALWRVHDVLETGTVLDANGRPAANSRALPDGEIAAGTPIPGVIPLPGIPMPPKPSATVAIVNGQAQVTLTSSLTSNPGFPFFVPGVAGHRPPKPPMDTIDDGGLPRHVITGGTFDEAHNRLDFHKTLLTATATQLAENGTAVESKAMTYHAFVHPSCYPNGTCDGVDFRTNARSAVRGAPFADPCPGGTVNRTIKGADIEDDVKINKKGWHFPQQRFISLWEDVDDFLGLNGGAKKPPEPLFFRANSQECIEYWFTNLVPAEYKLDDFQVRTPTDVLGQHIHLVKFDVLASDGAANGFNYEDGSFGPEEVRERIEAIRAQNGCTPTDARNGTFACPEAELHPFAPFQREEWRGAQTTVQRWYADPIRDNAGNDRTLRTVFTHDHFGPSTHQQAGLYAGLVIEPAGSTWKHNETGALLGGRHDGGPTTWQAVIDPPNEPAYREFLIEFGDFQLAYEEDSDPCRFDPTLPPHGAFRCDDPDKAVNPPGRREIGLPDLLARPVTCPGGVAPPCPEAISADDPGTMSVNYRQEPVALRVRDPQTNSQAAGQAGDLSYAFSSNVTRADADLNVQPNFYPPLTNDIKPKDPYTPLLRAYENDRVQIRVLVGAHEEGHNFSVHGIKWLFEPSEPDSGYKNSQMMGISEHFEFIVPQLVKNPQPVGGSVDRLWSAGSSTDDYWNGLWGLLRAYTGLRPDLEPLPENPNGRSNIEPGAVGAFDFSCPTNAPVRTFDVVAVNALTTLPGNQLTYNSRVDGSYDVLGDPTALLYFRLSDTYIDSGGTRRVNPGAPIEPLVLRARAGECIHLTLHNSIPGNLFEQNGWNTLPMIVEGFNANDIKPSNEVGLHPQLLYYDVSRYDGANVGGNAVQTVAGGQSKTYKWYAGDVKINADGTVTATPIEFGMTNLISSDRIEGASKGLIGALVIEPAGATWVEGASRAVADVTNPSPVEGQDASWRELVLQFQNDVNLYFGETLASIPVRNLGGLEDPEDTGQKAINYRTEPLWKRMQHNPETPFNVTDNFSDWWDVLANVKVGGDPVTPVFEVTKGTPIRFRLGMSGGHARNIVFGLHGHIWDQEPYLANSTRIGHNGFSFWEGARTGHGPTNHFDAVMRPPAGGAFTVPGDYLFRDQAGIGLDAGLWGILRVLP
ncbi:MAG TPA: copper oxidase [Thermoanaerobaculia bacterium]